MRCSSKFYKISRTTKGRYFPVPQRGGSAFIGCLVFREALWGAHVSPESEGETKPRGKCVACLALHTTHPGLHAGEALVFLQTDPFLPCSRSPGPSRRQQLTPGHLWDPGGPVRVCLPLRPRRLGMEGIEDPELGWFQPQALPAPD